MLKKIAFFAGSVLFAANLMAAEPAKAPHVLITTTNGDIEIDLMYTGSIGTFCMPCLVVVWELTMISTTSMPLTTLANTA